VVSSDKTTLTGVSLVGVDGSVPPLVSDTENLTRATAGVTFQAPNGFFVGGGLSWSVPRQERISAFTPPSETNPFSDYWDWQVRVGYHPGVRVYVPPPPPPPPPPPAAVAPPPPTAPVQPPPPAPAPPVAAAPRPAARTYMFEDVHFDFDRYSLRPEATRILDEAVTAMMQDATLRLQIEGHTCNIGTPEYNLALGDRRANAVRDYMLSRGIAAARLTTVSFGEEMPKYDNSREETRRLNRRAALVVNLR
jgi:outer membrane protein OmpA-like peptidoglycan-associated protein